jgi:hypothetical protein
LRLNGDRSCACEKNDSQKVKRRRVALGRSERNSRPTRSRVCGIFVEDSSAREGEREIEMSSGAWLQILMIIIPIGVLTVSVGAGSIGNTVELSNKSVRIEIPESAELFAAGTMLVGIAGSAQRVMRRKGGTA